ncbi:uncharacterized protein [Venturia canescens]|uniref:uncharacterized protein n=1 Tax=Venturia canescens TaxID=32260 RepID=UPI001C9C8DAA|nr:uncharacterized protein LOC122417441 [Venturia canescens]XP_043286896.1 uncharacterized protein LOC122417441 [Venturia canescens]
MLEKELSFFRDIVNDTVDRRIQDEADVMLNTQNDIKNKFRSLTDAMTQRTMRIRQRLYEISPTFNWARDGRDKLKISKFIIKPMTRDASKEKETTNSSNIVDKLVHQVFMRGQWLKKELTRLQEENNNLEFFLDKFRCLAAERKEQESYVPKMLSREKKELDRELMKLRKTYKKNLEIINALYIEHQRCIMPESETSLLE